MTRSFCTLLGILFISTGICQDLPDSIFTYIAQVKTYNTDSAYTLLKNLAITTRKDSLRYTRVRAAILEDQGQLEEAKQLLRKNLARCTPRDTVELSESTNNLGLLFTNLGANDSAAFYLIQSLEYRNQLGDSVKIAASLGNLGLLFSNQTNYQKAEEYLRQALEIKLTSGASSESLGIGYLNLGLAVGNQGRYEEELALYRKSLHYFKAINDLRGVSMLYNNMGWNYHHVLYNPDSAIFYYKRAIDIRKELKNILGTAQSLTNLAEFHIKMGKQKAALELLEESEKLAYEADSKREIYLVELNYARFLESIGNYQMALEKFKVAEDYEDSMINLESRAKVLELETKYQTAEKEQEIANQKLELSEKEASLRIQQLQIAGLIGGLVILILFGLVFYNQYRAKQNQKLQAAILSEKERGFESIIIATEEERKRISKDLHDGIGQQLSALKMALNNIVGKVTDDQQREDLELISEQFSKSAEEIRQVSHQMMPRTLMDYGLVGAIEDLLQNSLKFSDIQFDFEHHNVDQRFDERVEISLYRVLQELINNVIKHSGATEVSVQLLKNKEKLVLFVEDNGKGLDGAKTDGHGFLNIKSRLDMVKGSVNYTPSPESGTSATVSIPIPANNNNSQKPSS